MGGAGDGNHVEILANALNQNLRRNNFDSANTLKIHIGEYLGSIHRQENIMNAMSNGIFTTILRFSPLNLICAKINESFYLYDAGFGISRR